MRTVESNLSLVGLTLAILAASPSLATAQEQPATADKTAPATTATTAKPGGAVSSSYAAGCVAPGNPIGGIIVKGGQNLPATTTRACTTPDSAEATGDRPRTYTGGRRNDAATIPPAPTGKSISEQGVK